MPQDIKTIPIEELLDDLIESQKDIVHCDLGLMQGVTHLKSGDSIGRRKEINVKIVFAIKEEITRRVSEKEEA